jgi:hypothetical protein
MIILLQLLLSLNAHACQCAESTVEENFKNADVIATVKARAVKEGSTELEAIQVWKGGKKLSELTVNSGDPLCGFTFKEGEKYLVFATHEKGAYKTGLCSGNKELAEANKDILWLKLRGLKK